MEKKKKKMTLTKKHESVSVVGTSRITVREVSLRMVLTIEGKV